jgi:Ser/Thr protein kinase RdoA (MazF antagonist)
MAAKVGIEDVRACLGHYPALGEIASVAPPRQSEWHGHNTVFRAVCEAGVFYLKVLTTHPQLSTEEHYEFQDWAMAHFRAIGVQTPVALRNVQGNRLTLCAGYPAVLSVEVAGDEFHEEVLAEQESAGRTLGEFHRRAATSTPRGRSAFRPLGGYLLQDRSQLDGLPDIPERVAILEAADMLLGRSHRIAQELGACGFDTLPHTVVHTDFVGSHLRVCGDRVCGVLDFEYACFEARILDLGRSLTQLFCVGREAEEDGPARTRAFLRGYNSAGWPLEERELAAFPLAVKTYDFEVVTFPIHQMIETGRPYPIPDLDRLFGYWMMRVNWWEQHGAEVAEQLMRLAGRRECSHEAV